MDRPLHNPKSPSSSRRRRTKYSEQAKEKEAAVVSESPEQNAGTPSTESFLARAVKESPSGDTAKLAGEAKELLDDANGTSAPANHAWLAFLALLAFFLVTLAGVSHKDLLLNTPVTLPTIDMQIPLFSFFQYAPVLLLLVYLSLLIQHIILARKYRKFAEAVAPYEKRTQTEHPARELVHSYMVSQLLAGPRRNLAMRWLMRLTVFVTFALLPIVTLLYFQVKFLPYHALWITYWHRIAVLLGLAMLFVALPTMHLRSRKREVKLGPQAEAWQASPYGIVIGTVLAILIAGFSWLIATVPYEQVEQQFLGVVPPPGVVPPTDQTSKMAAEKDLLNPVVRFVYERMTSKDRSRVLRWLVSNSEDGNELLRGLLSYRVLRVEDTDMARDEDDPHGEVSVVLRERDLRFARLNRSDLHRADLTEADLSGADLEGAQLEKADLQRAKLRNANLYSTQLRGADLRGAELPYANLENAKFQGADLRYAELQKAHLYRARLQGADLRLAKLQGANLREAQLQGADLTVAEIWLASFPDGLWEQSPAPIGLPETSPLRPEVRAELEKQLRTSLSDGQFWPDEEKWTSYIDAMKMKPKEPSPDARAQNAQNLADLACSNSGIAEGLARRAIDDEGQGDYAKPLAKALLTSSCEGAKGLTDDTRARLQGLASTARP